MYPKIQESYETTYTYPTLKIQNLCNINTLIFYISKKFSKTGPHLYALYNIPVQHWSKLFLLIFIFIGFVCRTKIASASLFQEQIS